MRDGGKGDKPRPIPNWDHYKTNWDKIFENNKIPTLKELDKQREESYGQTRDTPDTENNQGKP